MIAIAFHRMLSKVRADWRVVGREQGSADRAWQGKRPAVCPAYVVGWLVQFPDAADAHAISFSVL